MEIVLEENIRAKEEVHPIINILDESMRIIKTENINEIFDLSEEEKKVYQILGNAIKKIEYKVVDIKEEKETATLSVNFKVPNLSRAKKKLLEKVENYQSKLNGRSKTELKTLSLKWFKQIIDEEIERKTLKYDLKLVNIKYKKIENEWEIEDDREFVEVFGFGME